MASKSVAKSGTKPAMKYHAKAKCEFRRLPFIGKSNWDVPSTGGYSGGCEMGRWAAVAYLKMLRAQESYAGGFLQGIVLDLIERGAQKDDDHSLRGQMVGFFSTLNQALMEIAKIRSDLDGYSEKDLSRAMARAVNFDEKAWASALQTIEDALGGEPPYMPFNAYRKSEEVRTS